jgi:crotonobetainyl-CoA:carnitine CoA-transferase CaiB-like acyl-CoA transferase
MITSNVYHTKDGRVFINVGVLIQLRYLYIAVGRDDLIDTLTGGNQSERIKYRDEIDAVVTEWTKTKTTNEVVNTIRKTDVPSYLSLMMFIIIYN